MRKSRRKWNNFKCTTNPELSIVLMRGILSPDWDSQSIEGMQIQYIPLTRRGLMSPCRMWSKPKCLVKKNVWHKLPIRGLNVRRAHRFGAVQEGLIVFGTFRKVSSFRARSRRSHPILALYKKISSRKQSYFSGERKQSLGIYDK